MPKIGVASPTDWPDAGAMYETAPASTTTATSPKTIRLTGFLPQPGFRTAVITSQVYS